MTGPNVTLFQRGDFTLRSGRKSSWKIECDSLGAEDWFGLAAIALELLPPFRVALGVPRGGLPFALALSQAAQGDEHRPPLPKLPVLIAEDVVTTGGSMERFRDEVLSDPRYAGGKVIGVAAFARGGCPDWVLPLFRLATELPRCPEFPKGERCALKWGHAGRCKWANGD